MDSDMRPEPIGPEDIAFLQYTGGTTGVPSWEDLGVDTYMADSGRYRRRRFAAFAVSSEGVVRNSTARGIL
jgi:hypothetical protein